MERWVNALADGSLTGFTRWYAQMHVSGCNQCRATLESLQLLRERLHALASVAGAEANFSLSPERRAALLSAFDAVDNQNLSGEI